MLTFALACFLLIVTPGPGVLSVAGVGSGFGFKQGSLFLWGLCLGNALVALAVASGIAAAVLSVTYVRELLLALSVCYMCYLAFKVAFAGSRVGFIEAEKAPRFLDGTALQLVNPKAYAANTFLFSGFNLLPDNIPLETVLKLGIWISIWIPMHFAWLMVGITIRRLELPERTQRAINIFMALLMLIVVFLAIFQETAEEFTLEQSIYDTISLWA